MPRLVAAFLIITLSSIGAAGHERLRRRVPDPARRVPLESALAAFAATGVILSAVYMLWMFQRVNYGPVTNEKNRTLPDLDAARVGDDRARSIAMAIVMGVAAERVPAADGAVGRAHRRAGHGRAAGARRQAPRRRSRARRSRPPLAAATQAAPACAGPRSVRPAMTDFARLSSRWSASSLAAIAAMLAEAFRQPGERCRSRPRRSSACSAPPSRRSCCGTRDAQQLRRRPRRQLRALRQPRCSASSAS